MRLPAARGLLVLAALALAPALPSAEESARELYKAGRFGEAAIEFMRQREAAPQDPWHHYNLGNALFKSGRLGQATASYLRAYRLQPRAEDLRFNLDFALRRAGESLVPPGVPRALFILFHAFTLRELRGLFLGFYWLAALLFCLWLLDEARRELLAPPLWGVLALWGLWALWLGVRTSSDPAGLAVITAAQAELRNGPGEGFSVGFTAPEGRRVSVLQERGDWVEVGVLKEGVKGWVRRDSVEKV